MNKHLLLFLATLFSLEPCLNAQVHIDSTIKTRFMYDSLLVSFDKGDCDSSCLRVLAFEALKHKNKVLAKKLSAQYLKSVKSPLNKDNVAFLLEFVMSTSDEKFHWIAKHQREIDSVMEGKVAADKMKFVIYFSEIAPQIDSITKAADWKSIRANIVPKYDTIGEAIFLKAKVLNNLELQNWNDFAWSVNEVIQKYQSEFTPDNYNDFAWAIFENVYDKHLLNQALNWATLSISLQPSPLAMDTKANLLYKLGDADAAITLQRQASSLAPDNKDLERNLQKMQNKQKTW